MPILQCICSVTVVIGRNTISVILWRVTGYVWILLDFFTSFFKPFLEFLPPYRCCPPIVLCLGNCYCFIYTDAQIFRNQIHFVAAISASFSTSVWLMWCCLVVFLLLHFLLFVNNEDSCFQISTRNANQATVFVQLKERGHKCLILQHQAWRNDILWAVTVLLHNLRIKMRVQVA